jgi:hypothetical protein
MASVTASDFKQPNVILSEVRHHHLTCYGQDEEYSFRGRAYGYIMTTLFQTVIRDGPQLDFLPQVSPDPGVIDRLGRAFPRVRPC